MTEVTRLASCFCGIQTPRQSERSVSMPPFRAESRASARVRAWDGSVSGPRRQVRYGTATSSLFNSQLGQLPPYRRRALELLPVDRQRSLKGTRAARFQPQTVDEGHSSCSHVASGLIGIHRMKFMGSSRLGSTSAAFSLVLSKCSSGQARMSVREGSGNFVTSSSSGNLLPFVPLPLHDVHVKKRFSQDHASQNSDRGRCSAHHRHHEQHHTLAGNAPQVG